MEICKGMDYLHKRQIIHRDLKAANLLTDDTGALKIADFGVARMLTTAGIMTAETGTYRCCGFTSPSYVCFISSPRRLILCQKLAVCRSQSPVYARMEAEKGCGCSTKSYRSCAHCYNQEAICH